MRQSGKILVYFPSGLLGAIVAAIGLFSAQRLDVVNDKVADLVRAAQPASIRDLGHRVDEPSNDAMKYLLSCSDRISRFYSAILSDPMINPATLSPGPMVPDISEEAVRNFEILSMQFEDSLLDLERALQCSDVSIVFEGNNGNLRTDDFRRVDFLAISQIMLARGRVAGATGRHGERLRIAMGLLKLARIIDSHYIPTGVRFLSVFELRRCAAILVADVLASCELTIEQRNQLNDELESAAELVGYVRGVKADRAWVIELLNTMPIQRLVWNGAPCMYYFERRIEGCSGNAVKSDMQQQSISVFDGDLLMALAPTWESSLDLECRVLNQLRALRVCSALQVAFGLNGDTRVDADYLYSIGIPEGIAQDVFTGQVLEVDWSSNMWHIHSTGNPVLPVRRQIVHID